MSRIFLSENGDAVSRSTSIWRYRELFWSLVFRNLKLKYQRSGLGFLWTLLNPLFMVGVLMLVFTQVVRIPLTNYWAFLISGYFVWSFIQQSMNVGAYVLTEHANVIRGVAFPKEILVISAVVTRLLEYVAELLLILIVLIVVHHQGVPGSFCLLPLLILSQLLLGIGLAFPIATVSAFYSDVQHGIPIVLTALFYISPVFYPMTFVPDSLREIFMINPFAQLLTLYHEVLYEGFFPSTALLGVTLVVSALIALAGYLVFGRFRDVFAELV